MAAITTSFRKLSRDPSRVSSHSSSAILDNLTTTIVMISLLKKLLGRHCDRLSLAGIIVFTANAGGAWSPIGNFCF